MGGTIYPEVKCPPPPPKGLRRAWSFEFSQCPSRGYWKQFLLSHLYEHSQNLPVVERDTLPWGKVSLPLNHHAYLHFYVMKKGNEKSLFLVTENTSRGYWKHFVLSRPYGQYLPVVVVGGGGEVGGTIYPEVKCPPPPQPSLCFLFYVMIKGNEKSLVS